MSKQCISNLWSFHHCFCRRRAWGKYHLCHWNDAWKTKMNTSNRLCYSCFLLYHFWPCFKYGNPLKVICACKRNLCQKKKGGGVFYVLLSVFLHRRTPSGGPFSAVLTRTGSSVCWLVCSHHDSHVDDSVASASFSTPLEPGGAARRGPVMLVGAAPLPSQAAQLPPGAPGAGRAREWLAWLKEDSTVVMSTGNWSLWLGVYWFLQDQQLVNLILEVRRNFQFDRSEEGKKSYRILWDN